MALHGLLLQKLSPDIGHLKYNVHFYILIVAATRGISELDLRKDLMKTLGHYDFSSLHRWCRIKKGSPSNIPHSDLMVMAKYFNSYIPELELTSDSLLTETNHIEKRKYNMSEMLPTARDLGLGQ